ncbi:uncharacterized protein LOC121861457 [Homarus americanus]|uniref:uncharacterized protein LOC121861457 n=1 Tax=Homarus americanus TaxID=6706 RepID=UPI001C48C541|nr:uncharacterized protein LOC121861457 [Homarus americanus]
MKVLVLIALVGAACAAALPADAPVPVTDTEEVMKAKAEFKAAFEAAAAAAAADEVPQVILPEGAPLPVEDTAEVAAAKANFQAAFDAAAARAEAAPDTDLDGKISTYTGLLSTIDGRLSPLYTNTFPYGAYGLHAPALAGAPLAYSSLGFPGYGLHGGYGLQGYPFIMFAAAEA